MLYICTLCDSTNINTITEFAPNYSYLVKGNGFNGGSDSYLPFRNTHAPCLLKLCIPPSDGIIKVWLFIGIGAEFPLGNCTPTITLNKHNYIYIDLHRKTNCMIILFPQKGSNVRIKGFHILNAAPFCDDLITLMKRAFSSKLAAKVSDFNLLHNLLRP